MRNRLRVRTILHHSIGDRTNLLLVTVVILARNNRVLCAPSVPSYQMNLVFFQRTHWWQPRKTIVKSFHCSEGPKKEKKHTEHVLQKISSGQNPMDTPKKPRLSLLFSTPEELRGFGGENKPFPSSEASQTPCPL